MRAVLAHDCPEAHDELGRLWAALVDPDGDRLAYEAKQEVALLPRPVLCIDESARGRCPDEKRDGEGNDQEAYPQEPAPLRTVKAKTPTLTAKVSVAPIIAV